jgi:hypothetical protein
MCHGGASRQNEFQHRPSRKNNATAGERAIKLPTGRELISNGYFKSCASGPAPAPKVATILGRDGVDAGTRGNYSSL